ncbi:pentatricopeptide repeat-containing protein At3g05340-like [Macadamia integrifolia]|uniref:pentatricopeptide repeat-containing protein At3g05340-like n=1 Tax=Macadamia integrifolia TaxID=60698 RepID=UPI001C4F6B40|nr:pentatricopeptide repeat-containing protein At3g05340-like [Macadamia integrifolia]
MKARWVLSTFNYHFSSFLQSSFVRNRCQSLRNLSVYTRNVGIAVNYVETSRLLSLCGRGGHLGVGSSLHACIIKHSEHFNLSNQINIRNVLVVWNSLIFMYSNCGELSYAVKVFDEMPIKDAISWNSMISGYLKVEEFEMGFGFFKKMHSSGNFRFDPATLTAILSACDKADLLSVIKLIHCLVLLNGYEREIPVANSLITSYFKCGCHISGRRVFDEVSQSNVITWTAVISGLAQRQFYEESFNIFLKMRSGSVEPNSLTYSSLLLACSGLRALKEGRQVHGLVLKSGFQSDLCIESALMDIYSKCNSMEDACRIFEAAEVLDEVSMTVILVGLAQNGFEEEAVQLFVKMVKSIEIDPNMVSAILGVFGIETSLALGQQIHSLVIKKNFEVNAFVSNGLINMYSKCGNLEESVKVFHQMVHRNSVSWNSMIVALARHGHGFEALKLYEKMQLEGVEPTDVTFLSLLHACSHIGSVEKGMEFLYSMTNVHGITPRVEHYACVVDLLGRAGCLNEAKRFIEGLHVDPGVLVWQALLGACSIHGDSIIGRYAADHLLLAAPESPAPYVLMANIYSSEGRWEERAKIIKKMKKMKVKKETGMSWIELEKKVHSFVVGDRIHPQSETIYHVLGELIALMSDEGYVPDERFLHYDLDQDCKEIC